jgi:hypothetical protein
MMQANQAIEELMIKGVEADVIKEVEAPTMEVVKD